MTNDGIVNVGWMRVEDAGERRVKIRQMHPADIRILGMPTAPRPTPIAHPNGRPVMQATIIPPSHAILVEDISPGAGIVQNSWGAFCKIDNVLIWIWEGENGGQAEN
jgi:hypothetical protein